MAGLAEMVAAFPKKLEHQISDEGGGSNQLGHIFHHFSRVFWVWNHSHYDFWNATVMFGKTWEFLYTRTCLDFFVVLIRSNLGRSNHQAAT